MIRLAIALSAALAAPATAPSLSILLPVLSFPDQIVTPSTTGCADQSGHVCILQE